MLTTYLGLPKQPEILIIIFLGICFLSMDFSLFHLKSNLHEIWQIELEQSQLLETCLKYLISAVLLARTFTLHIFLAFYIMMLWPAIFEEKPNLMLPWLLLGIVRCLIINAITLVVGLFICHKKMGVSPICFEYILAQIIEHGPSVYAWFSVLSFYRGIAVDIGGSSPSSTETLCLYEESSPGEMESQAAKCSDEEGTLERTRSYSLPDLNLDYMYSSRARRLPGEISIDVIIRELTEVLAKERLIREGSKSFDSLIEANVSARLEVAGAALTVQERTMKALEVSEADIARAKKEKGRFARILKEISVDDAKGIIDISLRFKSSKSSDHLCKKAKRYVQKSHSQNENFKKNQGACLCYLRKQLQLEQSNQTLLESEIANVALSGADKGTDNRESQACGHNCNANQWKKQFSKTNDNNNLNRYRVEVGSRLGFNTSLLLKKFALKKKTSSNFGCQVSMFRRGLFETSRDQVLKKLVFLKNLAF